ncbi:hypothetical protein [Flavobacterium sp.]|uniref:hypothetical protein n=1 Tax=Flavobacterium sp. TaxID=239 RepID=UPI0039E34FE0
MKPVVQKRMLVWTVYSMVVFCVVSYLSVMVSLLSRVGTSGKPTANIGFPFRYYFQFWASGNDFPNCGWRADYLIMDFALTWVLTTAVFVFWNRRKGT